jgi:8-oxo-dGTP pyrophosphatase MutT (NUDIX family)
LIEGIEYEPRMAAYAVARGACGSVAVVQTASGCFLPGGGSLPGETPQETVMREVREELAREVSVVREIGQAAQYFRADGRHYRMEALFLLVVFGANADGHAEYDLHWLDPADFSRAFFHECHAWAARLA